MQCDVNLSVLLTGGIYNPPFVRPSVAECIRRQLIGAKRVKIAESEINHGQHSVWRSSVVSAPFRPTVTGRQRRPEARKIDAPGEFSDRHRKTTHEAYNWPVWRSAAETTCGGASSGVLFFVARCLLLANHTVSAKRSVRD